MIEAATIFNSEDDSGLYLKRREAVVPVWRLRTVVRFQWLNNGGWGGIRFKAPSLEKHMELTRVRYLV